MRLYLGVGAFLLLFLVMVNGVAVVATRAAFHPCSFAMPADFGDC